MHTITIVICWCSFKSTSSLTSGLPRTMMPVQNIKLLFFHCENQKINREAKIYSNTCTFRLTIQVDQQEILSHLFHTEWQISSSLIFYPQMWETLPWYGPLGEPNNKLQEPEPGIVHNTPSVNKSGADHRVRCCPIAKWHETLNGIEIRIHPIAQGKTITCIKQGHDNYSSW